MSNISPSGSCYRKQQCFYSGLFSKVFISQTGKQCLKGSLNFLTERKKERKWNPDLVTLYPLSLPSPSPPYFPATASSPPHPLWKTEAASECGSVSRTQLGVPEPCLCRLQALGRRTPERRRPWAWDRRDKRSIEDFHRPLETVSWQLSRRPDRATVTSQHTPNIHSSTSSYKRNREYHDPILALENNLVFIFYSSSVS